MDKWEKRHRAEVERCAKAVEVQYIKAAESLSRLGASVADNITDDIFSFDKHPSVAKRAAKVFTALANGQEKTVVNGITAQWALANAKNDALCDKVLSKTVKSLDLMLRRYYSTNLGAERAFEKRKVNGLSLSDRIWRCTDDFKSDIELALDCGIRDGVSADRMSRAVRQHLRDPEMLFRRVRDEHGELKLSRRAANYHPGAGKYRSSYKNAMRLTRTETNMAYRMSDFERMQQLDFVVGFEVHTSDANHPVADICDDLKGKYPKTFVFSGWHPQCRCYTTTILKSNKELEEDNKRILAGEPVSNGSTNSINKAPKAFNKWIENNRERAKGWASMPYFVRDNPQYVDNFEVNTYGKAEKKFTKGKK